MKKCIVLLFCVPGILMAAARETPDELNGPLLFQAVRENKRHEVEQYIKRYGVSVDVRDHKGSTPLMIAAQGGKLRIVDFLLKNDADPNAQDNSGQTPLLYAVQSGEYLIAKELLNKGANPNITTVDLETPLIKVARNGNQELCSLLILNGADTQALDRLGRTVWDILDRMGAPRKFVKEIMREAEKIMAYRNATASDSLEEID